MVEAHEHVGGGEDCVALLSKEHIATFQSGLGNAIYLLHVGGGQWIHAGTPTFRADADGIIDALLAEEGTGVFAPLFHVFQDGSVVGVGQLDVVR